MDPVEEFAAWLRHLHREAKKPSYTEIVRRIRMTDPTASVVVSTISETLNGKRLPRWTTVEPIARVLGGPTAAEECLRRWKQADAARTPTATQSDTAPIPDSLAPGLETEGAAAGSVASHSSFAPGRSGEAADPDQGAREGEAPVHAPRGRQSPVWMVSAASALAVAVAAWAAVTVIDDRNQAPAGGPTAVTPTALDPRPTGGTSGAVADAPEAAAQPQFKPGTYETELTVNEGSWASPDGNIRIRVPGASTSDGPTIFVTTPSVSCPQTTVAIGDALIVPEVSGSSWTRITTVKVWAEDTPNGEAFDMYVQLQVDQGTGRAPQGQGCAS
ncbi:XRE family transcriptional regulator [Streptomyces griseus]|uniref:XRE family transcriptional regulator n=1 Tax=Streptomyces griseus TaxID=1911 RepID=UPI0036AEE340